MSDDNKIKLYDMLTNKYKIEPSEINKEWGIEVGEQKNFESGSRLSSIDYNDDDDGSNRMSDEEYEKRYGHPRGRINFLSRGQ